MINQLSPASAELTRRHEPAKRRDRIRPARAGIKGPTQSRPLPKTGLVSSPLTGMPYFVPILRWID